MTCPLCGSDTRVVDSRKNIDHIIRRRVCAECNHAFYTIEIDCDMHRKLTKRKLKNHDSED